MTEPPEAPPTMNDLMRAKPPVRDIFAQYHLTEQTPQTGTTEPKEANE